MTRYAASIRTMTTADLIELFADNCVRQGEENAYGSIAVYNKIYKKNRLIVSELKSRDGDRRRDLIKLFDHPNSQVRLNAARATRWILPDQARQVLEAIAASRDMPFAGDAGMALVAWDRGIWQPE